MTRPTGRDDGLDRGNDGRDTSRRRRWVWLPVLTIVLSGGYFAYGRLGAGSTSLAAHETVVTLAAAQEARPLVAAGPASEAQLRRLQDDASAMATAHDTFVVRCAACHGPQGQGFVGPNLSDDSWIHGSSLTAIRQVIADGVREKGMVPWKIQLEPQEVEAMAAFVGTLRGTNPPNPKPPEGEPLRSASRPR
jgi:cytochrome c oxidase cbb3-type subunit 3